MTQFGQDLLESVEEAVALMNGEGPGIIHVIVVPREVRERAEMTQAQMATLVGMRLEAYQAWEAEKQQVNGQMASLLRLVSKEPEGIKKAMWPL